ncbi:hypothetical protein J7T55_000049 [Diaporthe amygdali]|uniref:uncharacterized protein n=1 Tax=Phomopsis amygdali TaxID=1214568 RepID=UPI0022FF1CF5|nr:uncharacterized protein J7T55_000049 [Diaporthe amygdali]KAJ0107787.1 hypothetical protein J7T55_000049 [Diaporthe amygdali]
MSSDAEPTIHTVGSRYSPDLPERDGKTPEYIDKILPSALDSKLAKGGDSKADNHGDVVTRRPSGATGPHTSIDSGTTKVFRTVGSANPGSFGATVSRENTE